MNPVLPDPDPRPTGIFWSAYRWWMDESVRTNPLRSTVALLSTLWEFVRNSTPGRLRQRYGDADYDWENRVNTTSAAVGWRDRLLGMFHSPYQPTDPALFHEMISVLQSQTQLHLEQFTFIDLGSGKGRALLMASDVPFQRIIGVELLPSLHRVAEENILRYKSEAQQCLALQCVCGDATRYEFPAEPLVVFLFNPFPETGLRTVVSNLERSVREQPRSVYILYHNPLLENILTESASLRKVTGTHQYSIFTVQIGG